MLQKCEEKGTGTIFKTEGRKMLMFNCKRKCSDCYQSVLEIYLNLLVYSRALVTFFIFGK